MKIKNKRRLWQQKYFFHAVLLFLLVFSINGFVRAASDLPDAFIQALKKADIPEYAVGLYIHPLSDTGKSDGLFWELNKDIPYLTASTMKVVTTYSALEILGVGYRWNTAVYSRGSQDGDILNGDLIFKGSGDPQFNLESFWLLLRKLRQQGIRSIRGNLILDRSTFAPLIFDPAAFDEEPFRPYNAGPDALLLNQKVLEVIFKPNGLDGTVQVLTSPELDGVAITPPILMDTGNCNAWRKNIMIQMSDKEIIFDGPYPLACGDQSWLIYPAAMNDSLFFKAVFVSLWKELGGEFTGEVKEGSVSEDDFLLTKWDSPALPEVIRDTNKYSNNIMARHILIAIGSHSLEEPGSPEKGIFAIRSFLASKGIPINSLHMENGSGLSRIERISPETMGKILRQAYYSDVMPELMSSFPVAGRDGTLWRRFRKSKIAGKAHLKTGSIQNVRAVAGYILSASGKRYVVVMMVNHANAFRAVKAGEILLEWIHDNG